MADVGRVIAVPARRPAGQHGRRAAADHPGGLPLLGPDCGERGGERGRAGGDRQRGRAGEGVGGGVPDLCIERGDWVKIM